MYVRQSQGDSGCVDRRPHPHQSWTADSFLLAISLEEAAVLLGSIYYLNYYNPSKENPGPLRHPFLELLEKKQLEEPQLGTGDGGAYLLKQMAPGSWASVGVRGEGVVVGQRGVAGRLSAFIPHEVMIK